MGIYRQLQNEGLASDLPGGPIAIGPGYSATQLRRELPNCAAAVLPLAKTATQIAGGLGRAVEVTVGIDCDPPARVAAIGPVGEIIQVGERITTAARSEFVDAAVAGGEGTRGSDAIKLPSGINGERAGGSPLAVLEGVEQIDAPIVRGHELNRGALSVEACTAHCHHKIALGVEDRSLGVAAIQPTYALEYLKRIERPARLRRNELVNSAGVGRSSHLSCTVDVACVIEDQVRARGSRSVTVLYVKRMQHGFDPRAAYRWADVWLRLQPESDPAAVPEVVPIFLAESPAIGCAVQRAIGADDGSIGKVSVGRRLKLVQLRVDPTRAMLCQLEYRSASTVILKGKASLAGVTVKAA